MLQPTGLSLATPGWVADLLVASLLVTLLCGCDPASDSESVADVPTDAAGDDASGPDSAISDGSQPDGSGDASDAADSTAADSTAGDASEPDAGPRPIGEFPTPKSLGTHRVAKLAVPQSYDGYRRMTLVMALGGYDYFGWELADWSGLTNALDEHEFVLLMPDGLIDDDGSPFWNATDTCCDWYDTGVDDVGYLTDLIAEARTRLAVYPEVLVVGHSNGAFMGYRLACEIPAQLKGLISVAGSGFWDPELCKSPAPVDIVHVHGTKDDVMPFGGDSEAPGALEMRDRWAVRNACQPDSWQALPTALDITGDSTQEATGGAFEVCKYNQNFTLWTIQGGDHYPDFNADFIDQIVAPRIAPPAAEASQ